MVRYCFTDDFQPGDTVALRGSVPLTLEQFASDIAGLAGLLPPAQYVINLCRDRYRFAVGLAAALSRRQITLLPAMATPGAIARLAKDYPGCVALCDFAPPAGAAAFAYPASLPAQPAAIPSFPAEQPAIVLFTSGSTGAPQPQEKDWGMLVRSVKSAANRLAIKRFHGGSLLATVPHQHSYGLESALLLPLQNGIALQAERPLLPADIGAALQAMPGPKLLVTAPIHLRALLEDDAELPPVDLILSATAPLAPELAAAAERRFKAVLLEIYGCSEAGQVATRRTALGEDWLCFDGLALTQEGDATFAAGELTGDRRIRLNDIIALTGGGTFRLQGRAADMVNVAGKRASLAHLNGVLTGIEGVKDGVYLPPDGAARLSAVVVAPGLSREAILAALKRELDSAFLPRPLHIVDALPRNALGKLTRDALATLTIKMRKHG